MPLSDPNALTVADWDNLHIWLTLLWIFFPLVIIFAFSMLFAHAFIPSGVATGDYPPVLGRLRIPLTVIGVICIVIALVLFITAAFFTPQMFNNFWDRFFV